MSRTSYLGHVDTLRAVAVLAVVLYHLDPRLLPGGFVGVDVFFVISGYIVSRSVSHLRGGSLPGFVLQFYARRVLRIVPALAVCLVLATLLTVMFIPYAWLSGTSQRTGLAAFFGFSNLVLLATATDYFSPRSEFNSFTHTWSLGVEEQYYLVFPFLFAFWLRGRQRLAAVLFAVAAAASLALAATATDPVRAFFLLHFRFWELAAGALLFVLAEHRPPIRHAMPVACLSLAMLAVALATSAPGSTPFPGAVLPVLGTLGVILSFRALPDASWLRRAFAHPVPTWLGRISYSLYLWHWPVFVLFRWTTGLEGPVPMAMALAASLGAAALSYRWVEMPTRHSGRLQRLPRPWLVGAGVAVLVAGWGLSSGLWALRPFVSLSTVNRHAEEWFGGPARSGDACRVASTSFPVAHGAGARMARVGCDGPAAIPRRLFVIGDSHAFAYETMLRQLVRDTGLRVDLMSAGGCGVLNLVQEAGPTCVAFEESAFGAVMAALEPGDVVFLPALRVPRIADQFTFIGVPAALARVADPATAELRARQAVAFTGLAERLRARGARVVLEAPLPVFAAPAFRCADWFNRGNPICAGGLAMPRPTVEALRAPVLDAFAWLSAQLPGLVVWDPLPELCDADTCHAVREGRPLFFDGDHLSSFGNRALVPSFTRLLQGLP
jgi:peptidoglycan/LPS O-acetylase OafA/YrhL